MQHQESKMTKKEVEDTLASLYDEFLEYQSDVQAQDLAEEVGYEISRIGMDYAVNVDEDTLRQLVMQKWLEEADNAGEN